MNQDEIEKLRLDDIILIGPGSGCAVKHMYARFIRVNRWASWPGMAWLDVKEVHQVAGQWRAVDDVRMAYVAIAGIRLVRRAAPTTALPQRRRPTNAGPVVPRPRTSTESTGRTR